MASKAPDQLNLILEVLRKLKQDYLFYCLLGWVSTNQDGNKFALVRNIALHFYLSSIRRAVKFLLIEHL